MNNDFSAYQKLGLRTFIVFVLENSMPALVLIVIWIVLAVVRIGGVDFLAANFFTAAAAPGALANLLNVALLGAFVLIVLAILFAVLLASIDYLTYHFMLDENALRIEQGLLNKSEISIPYRQIQDVDLEQSFIHMMLGVARVAVLTAGHEGKSPEDTSDDSEIALPIIDKPRAEIIRTELLKRANIEKVTNVTPVQPASPIA
jgi:uncharacterized membrane protein YdbT with pleckstrin-like domain